jgi:hypothetical protein
MTGAHRRPSAHSILLERLKSHGGSAVSQFLRQELHGLFESVDKTQIPETCAWAKELGGYFSRFKGGALAPWMHNLDEELELDLEARATLAFFEVFPIPIRGGSGLYIARLTGI